MEVEELELWEGEGGGRRQEVSGEEGGGEVGGGVPNAGCLVRGQREALEEISKVCEDGPGEASLRVA